MPADVTDVDILPSGLGETAPVLAHSDGSWRRPVAFVGLAGLVVPGVHLMLLSGWLLTQDPGFLFVVMPFVSMGLFGAGAMIVSVVVATALTLRHRRPTRLPSLLLGIVAIPAGLCLVAVGGQPAVEGALVSMSGALVVLALATPGASREVGPLITLPTPGASREVGSLLGPPAPGISREIGSLFGLPARRPGRAARPLVRPGTTPWWELWGDSMRQGLPLAEWVAVALMTGSFVAAQVLLLRGAGVASVALLGLAMLLAVAVESGMKARRRPR